jgi:hypothetical protein
MYMMLVQSAVGNSRSISGRIREKDTRTHITQIRRARQAEP